VPGSALALALFLALPPPEPIRVRFAEGELHGFLDLRSLAGERIATGDLDQTCSGGRVRSRLVFRFRDGSRHEETTVFTQRKTFRLVSYRLSQRGPAFQTPMEVAVDGATGDVKVTYRKDGETKVEAERMDLPPDLANGLVSVALKDAPPRTGGLALSLLVATPKPRLVRLAVTRDGEDAFYTSGAKRRAVRWRIKIELGGLAGVLAPLLGKEPADSFVWIHESEAPTFLRSEAPIALGGAAVHIELTGPRWPLPKR
jgi:hypothetical protein